MTVVIFFDGLIGELSSLVNLKSTVMGEDEVKGEKELAFAYLKALEKKHRKYFKKARLKIMDCVMLRGLDNVKIEVVKKDLPGDIRHDIEMIF